MEARTGYFLISLDTELAWGHFDLDHLRREKISANGVRERENVARLLELFNDFGIVGTWAVVGHLFYGKCEECEICPVLDWDGKYGCFTNIYKTADQQWYGSDIIELLRNSDVTQEIGFHGYTHRLFDEIEMTADEARIEAQEWLRAAERWGIEPGAIVFPRNHVGHLSIFKEMGFVCFRGEEHGAGPGYSSINKLAGTLRGKIAPYFFPPDVYQPTLHVSGLVNLPASRWIGPDHRLENLLHLDALYATRLRRIEQAVRNAAKQKKVVHIWLHPYELRQESQFKRICELLSVVGELVERGTIQSIGMAELARQVLPALLASG